MTEFSSTYQKELLKKYIDGSINAAERHELEKMALDDPFLFDALEGYSSKTNKDKKPVIPLPQKTVTPVKSIAPYYKWIGMAASLVILLGVFWFLNPLSQDTDSIAVNQSIDLEVYDEEATLSDIEDGTSIVLDNKASSELAFNDEMKETDSHPTSKTAPPIINKPVAKKRTANTEGASARQANFKDDVQSTSDVAHTSTNQKQAEYRSTENAINISQPEVFADAEIPEQSTKESTSANASDQESFDESTSEDTKEEKESEQILLTQNAKRKVAPGKGLEEPISQVGKFSNYIKGNITDENGSPLIGANIIWSGTDHGTITDIDGNFRIERNSDLNRIAVSYTGYNQGNISVLPSDTFLQLSLGEAMLLEEVVVTGFGNPLSKKQESPSTTHLKAYPEIGLEAFHEFVQLQKNTSICSDDGYVKLQFIIKKNGELTKIKIKESLNEACDQEAIRLLEDAGKWKTSPEGWRKKVNFTMVFE